MKSAVGGSYPRDVVAGVATKRGPALLLAAKKAVRRAAALTRLAPAPKEVCILSTPPMRGRPAPNRALPGRSRPPSAAVQRRKLFPAPTAKNKMNQINSIKYLPSPACGAAPRPRLGPVFCIYLNWAGGRRIEETPPRRPLRGRRGGLSCY